MSAQAPECFRPNRLFPAAALALAASLAASIATAPAHAGGIFEIIHPEVEEGKAEFEILNTVILGDVAAGEERSVHELAFGFGITDDWKAVLAFEIANARGDAPVVEAIEIGNVFLLYGGHGPEDDHGHGKHDDDKHEGGDHSGFTFGLYAGAELPTESGAKPSFAFGPIGEAGIGPVTFLGNILIEVPTSSETPGLSYAVGASVPLGSGFAVGVEAYGGFEELFGQNTPSLAMQEHYAGPAVYAAFETADGLTLEPRAALLFGLTDASADMALSVNLELKF